MSSGARVPAPFPAEVSERLRRDLQRDGFALAPDVLPAHEVDALRRAAERYFDDAEAMRTKGFGAYIGRVAFETDPRFIDIAVREPIIGFAEQVLGDNCHLIAQNVLRSPFGLSVDYYHVDEEVWFPLPPEIERHDPRIELVVNFMTVQIPLTDVDSPEAGPTEYVPGSHYSGREPSHLLHPEFEGRKPVPMLCKRGDIYFHNGQCWHHRAQNTTSRTRYLLQSLYGRRSGAQRFYPYVNYRLPELITSSTDARLRRVFGLHPRDPNPPDSLAS